MNNINELNTDASYEIWYARTVNQGFIPRDKIALHQISSEIVQDLAKERFRLLGGMKGGGMIPRIVSPGSPVQMIANLILLIVFLSTKENRSSGSAVTGGSSISRRSGAINGGSSIRGGSHLPPQVVPVGSLVQWNDYTCAPAVMREIMLQFFPDLNPDQVTVNDIASRLRTTPTDGTSPDAVSRFIRSLGLDCFEEDPENLMNWISGRYAHQGQQYFGMLPNHAVYIIGFQYNGRPLEEIDFPIDVNDVTVQYLDPTRPGIEYTDNMRRFVKIFVIGRGLHPPR